MKMILGRVVFAVIALGGLGLVAVGVVQIHNKQSGARAKATVTNCERVGGVHTVDQCNATWVAGGSLVGGNGHVVLGPIDDANSDDIGKTLNVRIRGDHAYTSSLRVPIILIAIGLYVAITGVLVAIKLGRPTRRRARRKPPAPVRGET
jgi:hypothetical protein